MFHCPVSTPNEALLRVIRNRVPRRTIVIRPEDKPWLDDRCLLAHRVKQRGYRVWSRSKTQADSCIGYLVGMPACVCGS